MQAVQVVAVPPGEKVSFVQIWQVLLFWIDPGLQDEHMVASGKKPALQVRQLPLAWLQVRQVELQSRQALLPLEKLEVLH